MIPCECCCDDKKVRDLEKKVNKAVYSVAVNGEIIYPTDGVGNVNLGDIGGSTDARDIKMPDGTSVAVNIDDLNTAVKDAVSEVVPTPVTDGINLNETDGNGTVSRMLIRADDTLKFDGLNVGISEATDARITQAQADATTAGTKADDAQADADDAMTAANTAKTTAEGALSTANTAIDTANTAQATADDALTKANASINDIQVNKRSVVDTKNQYWLKNTMNDGSTSDTPLFSVNADDFEVPGIYDEGYHQLAISDTLKAKINGAISAIGASVVDTALEMNIDKADGSTATESLFSIGDGLEWVEGVLKATGGSSNISIEAIEYSTINTYISKATNKNLLFLGFKCITPYFGTPYKATITSTAYGYTLSPTIYYDSTQYNISTVFIKRITPSGSGYTTTNSVSGNILYPAKTASIPITIGEETNTATVSYFNELSQISATTCVCRTITMYEGLINIQTKEQTIGFTASDIILAITIADN